MLIQSLQLAKKTPMAEPSQVRWSGDSALEVTILLHVEQMQEAHLPSWRHDTTILLCGKAVTFHRLRGWCCSVLETVQQAIFGIIQRGENGSTIPWVCCGRLHSCVSPWVASLFQDGARRSWLHCSWSWWRLTRYGLWRLVADYVLLSFAPPPPPPPQRVQQWAPLQPLLYRHVQSCCRKRDAFTFIRKLVCFSYAQNLWRGAGACHHLWGVVSNRIATAWSSKIAWIRCSGCGKWISLPSAGLWTCFCPCIAAGQ